MNSNTTADSGVVHIVYCVATGLVVTGDQIWHQYGFPTFGEQTRDRFGFALTD